MQSIDGGCNDWSNYSLVYVAIWCAAENPVPASAVGEWHRLLIIVFMFQTAKIAGCHGCE